MERSASNQKHLTKSLRRDSAPDFWSRHRALIGLLLVCILGLPLWGWAQGGFGYRPGWTRDQIREEIRGLGVDGSVLYIAAHPDDENTRFLAFMARQKRWRTGYLSLTRGDGGQNLIGDHTEYDLGIIRTQELLAARRVDGAEQFFTRANDFGFSKNPDETWQHWDREKVLADVVWVIRLFKPRLLVTRFSPLPAATHGHHTASAQLAVEAFFAAGDSTRFPEQLARVSIWKPTRLVWNTSWWFYGRPDYDKTGLLSLDVGTYNPRLGRSYGEIAAESRSMHQSQGFGAARQRGRELEYFQWLAGDSATTDPLEGLERSVLDAKATPGWEEWHGAVRGLYALIETENTGAWFAALMPLRPLLDRILQDPSRSDEDRLLAGERKEKVNRLLAEISGVWEEATAAQPTVVPGDSLSWEWQVLRRNHDPSLKMQAQRLRLLGLRTDGSEEAIWEGTPAQSAHSLEDSLHRYPFKAPLPINLPKSGPFWKAEGPRSAHYSVPDFGSHRPESPPVLVVESQWLCSHGDLKVPITLRTPLLYKWVDPVLGERYRPMEVVPGWQVGLEPSRLVVPDGVRDLRFRLTLRIQGGLSAPNRTDTLRWGLAGWPEGWRLVSEPPVLLNPRSDTLYTWDAVLTKSGRDAGQGGTVTPALYRSIQGRWVPQELGSLVRIEYGHIPIQTRVVPVEATVFRLHQKTSRAVVGYLRGAGDEIMTALAQMGYRVVELDPATATLALLKTCQSVVLGVRFYNTCRHLSRIQPLLTEYVYQGGHLLVQYQTTSNLLLKQWTPIPLQLGRSRVTEEQAEVRFLVPEHSLLNRPNQLVASDFDGWVQERGLYFAQQWDSAWTPLLGMNDRGEENQKGSLLVGPYGKGSVIYCALSLFRQCPQGVPGAYRLLQNLVEYAP